MQLKHLQLSAPSCKSPMQEHTVVFLLGYFYPTLSVCLQAAKKLHIVKKLTDDRPQIRVRLRKFFTHSILVGIIDFKKCFKH